MSAAGVGFVHGMGFDNRDFSAAIVGLGVNGRLKLVDRGQTQELRHLKGGKPADAAEQAVETALFASRSRSSSTTPITRPSRGAHHAASRCVEEGYGRLFRNNFWLSGLGLSPRSRRPAAIVLRYSESYGISGARHHRRHA